MHSDHLRGTSWYGWFDISLRGMMHWHGVVLHRGLRRSDLIRALKENFTKDRQAYVEKEWHKRPLLENIDAVLDYAIAADRHVPPRVIFAREGDLAGQLAHRLVSLQYMCQRGLQGIRLKLNMKTTNYWKADVLFREDGSVIEVSDAHRRLILGRKLRGGNRGGLQDVTGRPRTAYEIELLIRASKERAAEKERARVAWLHGWMTDEEPAEVKPPSSSS